MKLELIKVYKIILTREQLIFQIRLLQLQFLSDFHQQYIDNLGAIKKDLHFIIYSIIRKEAKKQIQIANLEDVGDKEFKEFLNRIEQLFIHTFRYFKNYFPNNAHRIQNEHEKLLQTLKKLQTISDVLELSRTCLYEELRKCYVNMSPNLIFINLQFCQKDSKNSKFFTNKDKKTEFLQLLSIQKKYMLNQSEQKVDNYEILDKIDQNSSNLYIDDLINYEFYDETPKNFKCMFKYDEFNFSQDYIFRDLLLKNSLVQQTIKKYFNAQMKRNKINIEQKLLPKNVTPNFEVLNMMMLKGISKKFQLSNQWSNFDQIKINNSSIRKQNSMIQKRNEIQQNDHKSTPYLNIVKHYSNEKKQQTISQERNEKFSTKEFSSQINQKVIFSLKPNNCFKKKFVEIGKSQSFLTMNYTQDQNFFENQQQTLNSQIVKNSKSQGNFHSKTEIKQKKMNNFSQQIITAQYYEPITLYRNQQPKQYQNFIQQIDANRFIIKRKLITVQDSLKFIS